jgi:hypothetical protein
MSAADHARAGGHEALARRLDEAGGQVSEAWLDAASRKGRP